MRGTGECNARKTDDREYPKRQAICAQDVMLRRHRIHVPPVCRNGCTFSTVPMMMLETCLRPPPPPRRSGRSLTGKKNLCHYRADFMRRSNVARPTSRTAGTAPGHTEYSVCSGTFPALPPPTHTGGARAPRDDGGAMREPQSTSGSCDVKRVTPPLPPAVDSLGVPELTARAQRQPLPTPLPSTTLPHTGFARFTFAAYPPQQQPPGHAGRPPPRPLLQRTCT